VHTLGHKAQITTNKVAVSQDGVGRTPRLAPSKSDAGPLESVNLRDCGLFAANLKEGVLLRSSQVLRSALKPAKNLQS